MIRQIKAGLIMTAVYVTKFANGQIGVSIGVHTVRCRLDDDNLFARHPAKELLITNNNNKQIKRLDFAKRYQY